jgi:dephospho-CoA kinase
MPALQRAARVLEKVTKVGFQWNDMKGPLAKLDEEMEELKIEIKAWEAAPKNLSERQRKALKERLSSEIGDVFLVLCNLSYLMKISPEDSLRGTMKRFESRFRYLEKKIKEKGKTPEQSNLAEMDHYWNEAKKIEKIKVWGLTGGIGAGKSTAAKFLSELGYPVIDADLISREILEDPTHLGAIEVKKHFGTTDRSNLRKIIFENPDQKMALEKILHPLIQSESKDRIEKLALANHLHVVYEAALLVETGRYKTLYGLIVIESPEEIRIERALKRQPSLDRRTLEKVIGTQASDAEREDCADYIVKNSGTLQELRAQIKKLERTLFSHDRTTLGIPNSI